MTAVPAGLPDDLPDHLRPAQGRIYEALGTLDADLWQFTYRDRAVFAVRVWPDVAVDTVTVVGLDHALARRDAVGIGELWSAAGTVERMVREIDALGAPEIPENVFARSPLSVEAMTRLAQILATMTARDSGWKTIPSPGGVTLTRAWPDASADIAYFLSPDTAHAQRENGHGREVWRVRGTAEQVAAALAELPAPGEPGAPDGTDHEPSRSDRWGD